MTRGDLAGGAVGLVVLATAVTLIGTVGSQTVVWLKTGIWQEYPISMVVTLPHPATDWKGLQKIIDFALDLHVGCLVVLLAIPAAQVMFWFGTALERIFAPLPPRN